MKFTEIRPNDLERIIMLIDESGRHLELTDHLFNNNKVITQEIQLTTHGGGSASHAFFQSLLKSRDVSIEEITDILQSVYRNDCIRYLLFLKQRVESQMPRGVEIHYLNQFSRCDLWNWSILLEDGPVCTASWKEVATKFHYSFHELQKLSQAKSQPQLFSPGRLIIKKICQNMRDDIEILKHGCLLARLNNIYEEINFAIVAAGI